MEGNWKVTYKENTVGDCRIQKNGLYYFFTCSCRRIEDAICRLQLHVNEQTLELGVLVPQNAAEEIKSYFDKEKKE